MSLFSKLGDDVSEIEVQEMIKEADRDGDGRVSYQEFVRIITNSSITESDANNNNVKCQDTNCLESAKENLKESCSCQPSEYENYKSNLLKMSQHHKRKRHGKRHSLKHSVVVFVRNQSKSFRNKTTIIRK